MDLTQVSHCHFVRFDRASCSEAISVTDMTLLAKTKKPHRPVGQYYSYAHDKSKPECSRSSDNSVI